MKLVAKSRAGAAFAALLLGANALATSAAAYPRVIGQNMSETTKVVYIELQDDATGLRWLIRISADGKLMTLWIESNPNPEDTSTGPGSHSDKPDVAQLIKAGQITYKAPVAPQDVVQLMNHLTGKLGAGGGLGPRYNPSDDDNGHGHGDAPSHSMEVKKTQAEIDEEIAVANEIVNALETLGTAMGDGDEGGGESANGVNTNGNGSGKNPGDDQGDYTEGQNKSVGQTEKDLLGKKPDVVNPPHLDRTTGGESDHASTGGGAVGGASGHGGVSGAAHNATGTHG